MEIQQAVGENVKRVRRTRKMSIERTAAEAGISRSMLGQIERGETNPSVGTLAKLAAALRCTLEDLVVYHEDGGIRLVRELETKPTRLNGGKVVHRPLLPFEESSGLESYHVDVFISGSFESAALSLGTVAYLTVLSGTASVTVGDENFQMQEWDAMRFPADQEWRVENRSNSTVRLHLVYRHAKV